MDPVQEFSAPCCNVSFICPWSHDYNSTRIYIMKYFSANPVPLRIVEARTKHREGQKTGDIVKTVMDQWFVLKKRKIEASSLSSIIVMTKYHVQFL